MVALMNTFAIYEQFRSILGEERAKGFAEALCTMFEESKNCRHKFPSIRSCNLDEPTK